MTYQRKNIHIFAGLLTCGCCGYTMIASPDRERSDGWRPSVYKCSRQRRFGDCDNKYVSDVTLGPFALNFIANLIRASNSFGKSTSIETLEKKLLRGDMFSQVDHIERPGLEELEAEVASSITMSDEEFIAKASYFILSQQLQDKRFVDYGKFIRKIDPQIVKDFLNSVVTNFCIKNGLTASILFKNGLEVQFSYKAQE